MIIKQLRLKKGWTQEELALHSGLSTRTIQRAENRKSVGAESLKCLAAVFETSINALIQEHNMNTSNNLEQQAQVKLNKVEKSVIKYGQSLLKTSNKLQQWIAKRVISFAKEPPLFVNS